MHFNSTTPADLKFFQVPIAQQEEESKTTMDVNTEAKRIMAVSISKLYASRSQRGGMRLHRSLLLSMVMRSARDIYHSACLAREKEEQCAATAEPAPVTTEVPMDTGDQQKVEVPSQPEAALMTPEPEIITPEPAPVKAGKGGEKTGEDKENHSPVSPDRHSRKRRGKASVAPDFLPSKRARLKLGGERHEALRSNRVNCCRH